MQLIIRTLGFLLLSLASAATATSVLSDPAVDSAFARVDVAGIHYGDTIEQVRTTMRNRGWTAESVGRALPIDSFEDAVRREISEKTGVPFVSRKKVPWNEWYRKGAQTLVLRYRVHSKGTLVVHVEYTHNGVDSPAAVEAFQTEAKRKFAAMDMVQVGRDTFCIRIDAQCGTGKRILPDIYMYKNYVILRDGDAASTTFREDFASAVATALGDQDISL